MSERFKCNLCYLILNKEDLVEGNCPQCNKEVKKMCPEDHICTCLEDVQDGVWICDTCGSFRCKCGSHNVATHSRITGYLSEIKGWNAGKRQELLDRVKYNL